MSGSSAYEVIQIDNAGWRIEENGVRSFLFCGTDKALLVDSGFGTGNIRELAGTMTSLPIMLVNTHADRDHTGCNASFDIAYMHPSDFERYHSTAGAELPVIPLWDGDIIDLGGRRFEVILIPGHTPGSIALLDDTNRVLISGDSVQAGLIFMYGPGRDLDAFIASMEKLLGLRGRFDDVYPSHGPFPVGSDILSGIIEGAKRLKNGELSAADSPFDPDISKLYDASVASFLY